MKMNEIYLGDCIKIMKNKVDNSSINLIFADPPYNLSKKILNLPKNKTGGAFYKMHEEWDILSENEYWEFTENWIKESKRVLKDNGSLYVSCTQHNIGEIIMCAKKFGLKLNNIITWYKTNAMPNITKRVFTHSTEFVCWFVKGKKWIFNYENVKSFNPNKTKNGSNKQMRDFLDFIELPIVQGNERIKGDNNRAAHPTQKPEKLLELILTASSEEGDIILDPFLGTGTTCVVANRMNRNWIGIEKNKRYFEISKKRINNSNA